MLSHVSLQLLLTGTLWRCWVWSRMVSHCLTGWFGQKFGVCEIFFQCFWKKSIMLTQAAISLFERKKKKVQQKQNLFLNLYFWLECIPVMQSWIFSSCYSSLQCHVILQKSFQITDLVLMKHFFLSVLKKVVLLNIFVETMIHFFPEVFSINFEQFNACLLNKSINFFSFFFFFLNLTDPKL